MVQYTIVPAKMQHAKMLIPLLRSVDKEESWASARLSPEQAVMESMANSVNPIAAFIDERIMCIYGVAKAENNCGIPWMLSTEELPKHARAILQTSRNWLEEQKSIYQCLYNFVDARNHAAIRWLGWLGFDIHPATPYGPDNMPFHFFKMDTNNV